MKKIIVTALSIVMIVIVAGCQKEQILECSLTEQQTGIEIKQTRKYTFKGNKITNLNLTSETILGEEYLKYKDVFVTALKSSFDEIASLKEVTINSTDTDAGVTIIVDINVSKMDEESKEKLNDYDITGDYEQTKKTFEEKSYVCK